MTIKIDSDTQQIIKGMHAGSLEAIKNARRMGTNLAIWRDGRVAVITPEEAEKLLEEKED